jgi:hypothetical protein
LTQRHFYKVLRVNWLRAKARRDRWQEELKIVESEMEWTLRYYGFLKEIWSERAEWSVKCKLEGHKSYAEKQMWLWGKMQETTRKTMESERAAK